MIHTIANVGNEAEQLLNIALLFGLVILGGAFGARFFQKLQAKLIVKIIKITISLKVLC